MKYILVLLVVMFAIGLWQHNRRQNPRHDVARRAPPSPPRASASSPQDMVVCAHCGVHMPVEDALNGARLGVHYCCADHRTQGEAGK